VFFAYTKYVVNAIAWAPHELGLILASASSDCTIVVNTYQEQTNNWEPKIIKNAHEVGCNAISWAPSAPLASLTQQPDQQQQPQQQQPQLQSRLVSGGGDNTVKVWVLNYDTREWENEFAGVKHTDWVRDVAWAPNIGLPYDTIASCSQDQTVLIWRRNVTTTGNWEDKLLNKFNSVVWRVSWSLTGNLLAVSTADNQVTLWKEAFDGKWTKVSSLEENQQQGN
jgi:protein transport protein SEC13